MSIAAPPRYLLSEDCCPSESAKPVTFIQLYTIHSAPLVHLKAISPTPCWAVCNSLCSAQLYIINIPSLLGAKVSPSKSLDHMNLACPWVSICLSFIPVASQSCPSLVLLSKGPGGICHRNNESNICINWLIGGFYLIFMINPSGKHFFALPSPFLPLFFFPSLLHLSMRKQIEITTMAGNPGG